MTYLKQYTKYNRHKRIFGQVIDHFIAWLKKAQNVPPPYLLILDGCSSHVSSVATLRKLIDAQVHALTMPAHTSSVLQPLDVGVFAPFKAFLRKATADIRLEGTRSQFLPKADMAEVRLQGLGNRRVLVQRGCRFPQRWSVARQPRTRR